MLLSFVKEGFERGEKAFHVVDPELRCARRTCGAFIIEVMRTHPMIIIGGILQENPFFVPPEEFLRELQRRAATQHVKTRL